MAVPGVVKEQAEFERGRMADNTKNGALFRVEGLTKNYPMGEVTVHALRGVSLEVSAGEFLVILGPSGSGKSTLLNIIGGIDSPTDGRVFFRDEELSRYSESQLTRYRRRHIGFVFQFYNLMPNLTALENVELARQVCKDPLDPYDMLARVGLQDRMDNFPAQLSGGEQQRVAIARALCKNPALLLCDEPTGALDSETGRMVLTLLRDIGHDMGKTVMIITHNAAIIPAAQRVIRMKNGGIQEVSVNPAPTAMEDIVW